MQKPTSASMSLAGLQEGQDATLENLGATLEAHPLGDYPKLWQLLLEFRRNKDDPDTNLRFIKFIERHQGSTLENNPHPTI